MFIQRTGSLKKLFFTRDEGGTIGCSSPVKGWQMGRVLCWGYYGALHLLVLLFWNCQQGKQTFKSFGLLAEELL